jgi:hypothetical protein
MNRHFRTLAVGLLAIGAAALAGACSSSSPGAYGDACTVYSVDQACETGLDCRCRTNGCFCALACNDSTDCPNKYDQCVDGINPATNATGSFCFRFKADGGPLP